MSRYQICRKTVIDSSYPGVTFDQEEISDIYWNFKKHIEPSWRTRSRRELEDQCCKIRAAGRGKDFDCLLGLSGGLDSSFMLHTVVKEFGLRPLVFHVDGGWNTELAVHNINSLIDKLRLELFTEVINWDEMRDFQLSWFKSGVPHIDIPQDHAFIAVIYKFAEKHKIKTILNGGNVSTECVSTPLKYFYWGTDPVHIRDIIQRYGTTPLRSYPFSSVFRHKIYLRYLQGVKVVKPLNYIPCSKELMLNTLEKEYNWKPYPQKHFESRFTRFFEGYWLPSRFGFDIRRVQFSSLILTNQMNREEALKLLQTPALDRETVKQEFEYVANKLGISEEELRGYHNMPLKFYYNYKNMHLTLALMEKVASALNLGRRGGAI